MIEKKTIGKRIGKKTLLDLWGSSPSHPTPVQSPLPRLTPRRTGMALMATAPPTGRSPWGSRSERRQGEPGEKTTASPLTPWRSAAVGDSKCHLFLQARSFSSVLAMLSLQVPFFSVDSPTPFPICFPTSRGLLFLFFFFFFLFFYSLESFKKSMVFGSSEGHQVVDLALLYITDSIGGTEELLRGSRARFLVSVRNAFRAKRNRNQESWFREPWTGTDLSIKH